MCFISSVVCKQNTEDYQQENIRKPKDNLKAISSWRKILYKGAELAKAPIFAEPLYQIAGLTSAVAIQSFCARGIPPALTRSFHFNWGIMYPAWCISIGLLRYAFAHVVVRVVHVSFHALGISTTGPLTASRDDNIKKMMKEPDSSKRTMTIAKRAARVALIEEVYFRFVLQGTLISLAKLHGFSNLTPIRVFTCALFGLAHAEQSLTQAVTASITSFCFEARLFENYGLLAAVSSHLMNNFIAYTRLSFLANRKKEVIT